MIQLFVKFPFFKRMIPSIGTRILRFLKRIGVISKLGE
jgi:hypothetical protein